MTSDEVGRCLGTLRRAVDRGAVAIEGLGNTGRDVLRVAKVDTDLRRDADVVARAFGLKLEEI